MDKAEKSSYEEQFSCSVCLEVLKEPVTIPCGHNYCMICINNFWSGLDPNAVYSCPQCRETFSPRPALKKNTLLAEVMEKMKNPSDQAASSTSDQVSMACVKMECDFCIGVKNKADKFCQQCLAYFCELHLQPHYQSPAFMKHKLVQASAQVQENICPRHGKPLDIYCSDDQQCICYLCMVESHNKHTTSSVESERNKNQIALERTKTMYKQLINQREEGLTELTRAVTSMKCFAQTSEQDSERIFDELVDSIKGRCSEVKTLIRAQEKGELIRAEELHQQLDHELTDLRARMAEIDQLSSTNDHVYFIRNHKSVCTLPTYKDLPSIKCLHENISMSVLKEHVEDVCQQEIARISREVMNIHVAKPSEPQTRKDFLHYFCDLHMDPNTINRNLLLSEGGKKVTHVSKAYSYPDHPERFDCFTYVLCKEDLYGRCYWEADCRENDWSIAVTYKGIERKRNEEKCLFGYNAKSWRLCLNQEKSYVRHNKKRMPIRQADSTTIGVYLDHSAGNLSFYSVSDQMTLLYTFHATFTESLYVGFNLGKDSVIRILQVNKAEE